MTTTTSIDTPLRLPLAHGLFVRAWLGGLNLLSTLLVLVGMGGVLPWVLQQLGANPWPALTTGAPVPLRYLGVLWAGLALSAWQHWQVKRLEREGWESLQAGRHDAAIRAFEAAAFGGKDALRARSHYGLSVAWLRKGDYERALSCCETTTWVRGRRTSPVRDARAPGLMAAILALDGHLDEARSWLGRIQRPMFDKTDYALLAQAVMLCREGRYVDAVKRIQRSTRENVPEMDVGAVGVLHAFARSRLGGQLVPLKPGCVLPEKPGRASGYGYLAREWPELAAFLKAVP